MTLTSDLLTYTSPSFWYSLSYPKTWEFEEGTDCTTFYKKNSDVEVLQISAYETDTPQSATENLIEYLNEEEVEAEIKTDLMQDGEEIATCSYEKNEYKTRVWFITKGVRLLFITFNSLINMHEGFEVSGIIQSLQIMPSEKQKISE